MTCQVFLLYKHLFCNLHHLSLTFCLLPSQKHVPFRTTWGSQGRFLLVYNSKNGWTGGYISEIPWDIPTSTAYATASSWGQKNEKQPLVRLVSVTSLSSHRSLETFVAWRKLAVSQIWGSSDRIHFQWEIFRIQQMEVPIPLI